ncbi:hypothetical protein LCGC14_1593630 [marine sediment metagenome]|uniref:Uncharacterized protein n=1 Tax=marine sediment metagenome TaxID=412755 RepID=A0A0F9KU11_9ZZZZ
MTEKLSTVEELLDWSNSVGERRERGKDVPELEAKAAEAVFEYCVYEAYKQRPMQVYYMILKRGDVC